MSLRFEHVSLVKKGPTLGLSIDKGGLVVLIGPSGSGKSHFLACIAGETKPARGTIDFVGKLGSASSENFGRRDKPQSIAKSASSGASADQVTAVLTALGLWDIRQQGFPLLPPARQAAARLIQPMMDDSSLVLFDHDLDQLDPWTMATFLPYLRARTA